MQCNFGTGAGKRGTVLTQALKGRKLLLVGFTLFSMFFGAGNLIFPPDLGAKAGTNFWPAFLGLTISAVGLPVAGSSRLRGLTVWISLPGGCIRCSRRCS